jgi:hypothetical protein
MMLASIYSCNEVLMIWFHPSRKLLTPKSAFDAGKDSRPSCVKVSKV